MYADYYSILRRGRVVSTEIGGLYTTFELNGTRATLRNKTQIVTTPEGLLAEAKCRVRRVFLMRLHNRDQIDEIVSSTFYAFAKRFGRREANALLSEYDLPALPEDLDLSNVEPMQVLRERKSVEDRVNRHASEIALAWIEDLHTASAPKALAMHNKTDRKVLRLLTSMKVIEVAERKVGRGGYVLYQLSSETDRVDLFTEQVDLLLQDNGYHSRRVKPLMSPEIFEGMLKMLRTMVDKTTPLPVRTVCKTPVETGVVPDLLRDDLLRDVKTRITKIILGDPLNPPLLDHGIEPENVCGLDKLIVDYFRETGAIQLTTKYRHGTFDATLDVINNLNAHISAITERASQHDNC